MSKLSELQTQFDAQLEIVREGERAWLATPNDKTERGMYRVRTDLRAIQTRIDDLFHEVARRRWELGANENNLTHLQQVAQAARAMQTADADALQGAVNRTLAEIATIENQIRDLVGDIP